MALLKSRVLTSLARRGFFLGNSAIVGPPGETVEPPQATLDEINLKYDEQFGKIEDVKKIKAEDVRCDERVCVINTWKKVKNSSSI